MPNNVLGTSTTNPNALVNDDAPDTDSRLVKVTNGITEVTPNFMHDHTRYEYISPTGNSQTVNWYAPLNQEDRSLHWLTLDNSNNSTGKSFVFSADYVFLDDSDVAIIPNVNTLTLNTYTLPAGEVYVWWATVVDGKVYLRVASSSDLAI